MDESKIRIAVSGAGGGAGQSILKALQDTEYEVIALDGEPLGTGLYTTNTSYIIPYSNSPDYIEKVLEICQRENCKLYFPGLDAELPVLTANRDKFTAIGTTVVVSSPDVVNLGDNKMVTFTELSAHGFTVPITVDMANARFDDLPFGYPFILKQREGGARSQNLYLIKTKGELDGLLADGLDASQFIAQEYIDGDEYTCGSVNLDGECKGVIVMRRILRDGDTYKCFSVRNELIEGEVAKIMNAIKPFGACNAQLRIKDGKVYVFEINARCSGTTAARALSGFNEPKMIADYLCHGIEPSYDIKEQTILRYWKELVVPNELVEQMKKDRTLKLNDPTKL
jgi:carbamoyl-phosphate synthase large subunit